MAQSNPRQSGVANGPYMNSRQLQYFQDKLLGSRKRLHSSLDSVKQTVLTAAETSPDWIDTASAQTQAEMVQVNRQRAVAMIREIDAALERIQDGSYGFCIESGEEIGIKRLLAMPTAQFSVVVQEEKEQRRRVIR